MKFVQKTGFEQTIPGQYFINHIELLQFALEEKKTFFPTETKLRVKIR